MTIAADVWEGIYAAGRAQRTWPSEDVIRFATRRLAPGSRVLDVGCGNGANLWYFTSCRHRVIGLDCSETALEFARRLCQIRDPMGVSWLTLCHGDLGALEDVPEVRPESFDAIIDCRVTQHITWAEHQAVYLEFFNLLKPGGWYYTLHLDDGTIDAGLNDHLKASPDTYTWTNVEEGVYPHNGIVSMPPAEALVNAISAAGFLIARHEQVRRQYLDDDDKAGFESSHASIDAQRPA